MRQTAHDCLDCGAEGLESDEKGSYPMLTCPDCGATFQGSRGRKGGLHIVA